MEIRFTWDPGNIFLFGIYKLDGKLLIMLPGLIIDFPGKRLPNGKMPDISTCGDSCRRDPEY